MPTTTTKRVRRIRITIRVGSPSLARAEQRPYGERGTPRSVVALASEAAPGLAVHRAPEMDDIRYAVTHVASGYRLYGTLATLDGALALMHRLAPCGDWTRSGEAMLADDAMRRAAGRIFRAAVRRGELDPMPVAVA